jgi:hypothetical protein
MWPWPFMLEMAFLAAMIAVLIFSRRYSRYAAGALALYAATSLVLRALDLRS